jgi:hypothetical protein
VKSEKSEESEESEVSEVSEVKTQCLRLPDDQREW